MSNLFKGIEPEDELPEPLKGKSSVEVFRALQKEFDEIHRMNEVEKETLSGKVKALEDVIKNTPKIPQQQYQQPAQEEPLWTGPDDIVNKVRQEMVTPLANMADNMRAINRNNFIMKLQQGGKTSDWEKYGGEIEQAISAFAPAAQSRPEAYEAAYSYVKGIHVDEIIEERTATTTEETVKVVLEKLGYKDRIPEVIQDNAPPQNLFQRQTGVPHVGKSRTVDLNKLNAVAPTLSAEQLRVARNFGMTPEEYIKHLEA